MNSHTDQNESKNNVQNIVQKSKDKLQEEPETDSQNEVEESNRSNDDNAGNRSDSLTPIRDVEETLLPAPRRSKRQAAEVANQLNQSKVQTRKRQKFDSTTNKDNDNNNELLHNPITPMQYNKRELQKSFSKLSSKNTKLHNEKLISLANNITIAKSWKHYESKTDLDDLYLNETIIPLKHTFFGRHSLEFTTNRNLHLLITNQTLVIFVQPSESTVKLARIIDFKSIKDIKLSKSRSRIPMIGLKIEHKNNVLFNYIKAITLDTPFVFRG